MRHEVGLGEGDAKFKVYIANRPAYADLNHHQVVQAIRTTEIASIGQSCGNGWRKVFNVYAKLLFACPQTWGLVKCQSQYSNWQAYRDKQLLQAGSGTALLFNFNGQLAKDSIHLIMGRTYAKSLSLPNSLMWLDQEFAIDIANRLIVCPYFDYRQLSNAKIITLVALISQLIESNENMFLS